MIGNPLERRKAERFSELLDAAEGGRRRHNRTSHDDDLAPMVNLGSVLSQAAPETAAATAPRPEFQAALRQRLLAVAEVQGIGATANPEPETTEDFERHPGIGRRRLALAAALAAGVIGLSGVSTASGDALPGDALYPVKRSTERAQLALAGSDVNRGQLHFEFARNRLAEALAVDGDPEQLKAALTDMDSETLQGTRALTTAAVERQDVAILDTIDGFVEEQSAELAKLQLGLSDSSYTEATESLDLLAAAAERSSQLRGALLCTATTEETGDKFGPIPGQCTALPGGGNGKAVAPEPSQSPKSSRSERDDPAPDNESATASPNPSATPSPGSGAQSSGDAPSDEPTKPDKGDDDDDGGGGLLEELGDALSGLLGR